MIEKKKIIFRADGNVEIGLGHIMRSLALANMVKGEFKCVFATRFVNKYLEGEILRSCEEIIKLKIDGHFDQFLEFLSGDEIVVLDNYFFSTAYQKKIKRKGCKLVCIDDTHDIHFVSDIVINHAPGITQYAYSKEENTELLLGPEFLLLRPEFLKETNRKYSKNIGFDRAFICFGGSDQKNLTLKVLKEIISLKDFLRINIVVGSSFNFLDELKDFVKGRNEVNVYKSLTTGKMIEVMKNSDFAIVPCSTILFEALAIGLPVITGGYIENQKNVVKYFKKKDIGHVIDDFNSESIKKEHLLFSEAQSKNAKENLDGKSSERLLRAFKNL